MEMVVMSMRKKGGVPSLVALKTVMESLLMTLAAHVEEETIWQKSCKRGSKMKEEAMVEVLLVVESLSNVICRKKVKN
jgi:hypothetical protein